MDAIDSLPKLLMLLLTGTSLKMLLRMLTR